MARLSGALLCGLSLLVSSTLAGQHVRKEEIRLDGITAKLWKRTTNATEYAACEAIQKAASKADDVVFLPYTLDNEHYMVSSSQASTCVYTPSTADDIAAAIKIIGEKRVRFAIECSGHASNQGFSSTPGVHISMANFQGVTVSSDNTYVDIEGGISWADVYKKLDSSTVNVVGGRVPGPGIGGFVTGGGGYSWISNQYGLTGDTLISADLVLPNGTLTTASESENPDLFWAIKGGGNSFGIIYSFRLKAVPRPSLVYADTVLDTSSTSEFTSAIAEFASKNTDPKAQIIPAINYVLGLPTNLLIAYYDGLPDYDPFSMFNQTLKNQTFTSFVSSLGVDELESGQRGTFNTVSLESYSQNILDQIANQMTYWGKQSVAHSSNFISYDIEPFLNYSQYAKDAAWPHTSNSLPLNLYFAWTDEKDDGFWHEAILESCRVLVETARLEGQKVDDLLFYPNYAFAANEVGRLYGGNEKRIEELRREYDPDDVMLLTTYFRFSD